MTEHGLFGFRCAFRFLDRLFIFRNRFIKKEADELSLVGVALESSYVSQSLVLVGADVGSGKFRPGLSLVGHV